MKRWIVKADGCHVWTEYGSKEKAERWACHYQDSCLNQDEPFCPNVEIIEEAIPDYIVAVIRHK